MSSTKDEWSGDTSDVKPPEEHDEFEGSATSITPMAEIQKVAELHRIAEQYKAEQAKAADVIPIKQSTPPPRQSVAPPQRAQSVAPPPARAETPSLRPKVDPRLSKLRSLQMGGDGEEEDDEEERPKRGRPVRKRKRKWGRWVFLLVLLGGGYGGYRNWPQLRVRLLGLLGGGQSVAPNGGPAIRLLVVSMSTDARTPLNATGYVAALNETIVGTTVGGRVKSVAVSGGQSVKRGQLLVQLEDGELRADLSLANARLREKERAVERLKKLVKADVETPAALDKARGEVDVARAEARVYEPKLKQLRILAPVDGTITSVSASAGEVISPGSATGVAKISDLIHLGVSTEVSETDISRVHIGDRAEVQVEAATDKKLVGTVKSVAAEADKAKGTVEVGIELPVEPRLQPGMSAKIHFQGSGKPVERLLIPKEAVLHNNAVWVVTDGLVHLRTVVVHDADLSRVEAASGLKEGERIVAGGGENLAEGDRVNGQ